MHMSATGKSRMNRVSNRNKFKPLHIRTFDASLPRIHTVQVESGSVIGRYRIIDIQCIFRWFNAVKRKPPIKIHVYKRSQNIGLLNILYIQLSFKLFSQVGVWTSSSETEIDEWYWNCTQNCSCMLQPLLNDACMHAWHMYVCRAYCRYIEHFVTIPSCIRLLVHACMAAWWKPWAV